MFCIVVCLLLHIQCSVLHTRHQCRLVLLMCLLWQQWLSSQLLFWTFFLFSSSFSQSLFISFSNVSITLPDVHPSHSHSHSQQPHHHKHSINYLSHTIIDILILFPCLFCFMSSYLLFLLVVLLLTHATKSDKAALKALGGIDDWEWCKVTESGRGRAIRNESNVNASFLPSLSFLLTKQ